MDINQTTPSPEISEIPTNIPSGVFVPNNQTPVQNVVASTDVSPVASSSPVAPTSVASTSVASTKEGALDKVFKGLARFLAKITGQPDPITGAPNPVSQTVKKTENIVGKVRNAANQAVEKASEVAEKTTNAVNQATEKIQEVIPAPTPSTETPVVQTPEQPTVPLVK